MRLWKFTTLGNAVWNGPKGSRWAQMGPKWSKRRRLTILGPFEPFWTTLERWQACHVWPFLVQNGPYWTKNGQNGPYWTKNGQTWQACQCSKVVQKGPKATKMVNISVFDHLGPLLRPSEPFWTILDKIDFLPQMNKVGGGRGASEQNIDSCLKWSKRVQIGPKGSKMVKNT